MNGRTNCGGSLKLHVVGGTTKPSSVAENTIWLNTSTAIPKWCVQNSAPDSPSAGDVYITVRTTTSNALNIGSAFDVTLYLGTAWQYQSGAWVQLLGEVYYSGSWHGLQTFVYDGTIGSTTGNYNADIGGQPWTTGRDGGDVNITNYDDHFTISFNPYGQQWTGTNKKIDFTNVNTVKFTYTASGYTGNLIVYTTKSTSGTRYPDASAAWTSGSSRHSTSINVSGLTGQYWLGTTEGSSATGQSGSINIFSIELIT